MGISKEIPERLGVKLHVRNQGLPLGWFLNWGERNKGILLNTTEDTLFIPAPGMPAKEPCSLP